MFGKALKFAIIIVFSIILVTLSVDAVDNYNTLNQSIIGRLIGGKEEGRCPADMVFVGADSGGICIDAYEASVGDKCPYADPQNEGETSGNISEAGCLPVSLAGKTPWRSVTQIQAINLCAKAGKRLPTNEEWFAASLGTPDKERGLTGDDCQTDNNWGSQPGLSGSGKKCVSYAGVYDMIGNVWEWVKGEVNDGAYKDIKLPADGYITAVNVDGVPLETNADEADPDFNGDYLWLKSKGVRGLARGGYWGNDGEAGLYSWYAVTDTNFAGTGVGFRCVKEARNVSK